MVSRYNESISTKLLAGRSRRCTSTAWRTTRSTWCGCPARSRFRWWPSGWRSGKYAAVICLGAVIRGETTHDQHINRAVSLELADIARAHRRAGVVRRADVRDAGTSDPSLRAATSAIKGANVRWRRLEMVSLLKKLPEHDAGRCIANKGVPIR